METDRVEWYFPSLSDGISRRISREESSVCTDLASPPPIRGDLIAKDGFEPLPVFLGVGSVLYDYCVATSIWLSHAFSSRSRVIKTSHGRFTVDLNCWECQDRFVPETLSCAVVSICHGSDRGLYSLVAR